MSKNIEELFSEIDELVENDELSVKAEMSDQKKTYWLLTWNNPNMSDEQFSSFLDNLLSNEVIQYARFQRESAPTTSTIHIHCLVSFGASVRFSKVKQTFPYGVNIKPVLKTPEVVNAYCAKDETRVSGPYTFGEMSKTGVSSAFTNMINMISNGSTLRDLRRIYTSDYARNHKCLKSYYNDLQEDIWSELWRDIEVIYLYGPPRTGKTSYVLDQYANGEVFEVSNYGRFMFDGYNYERVILLDEFYDQVRPITAMNKLLEPQPNSLDVKGGRVMRAFNKVYIVSNFKLNELYPVERQTMYPSFEAFTKRINKIIRFDEDYTSHVEKETIFEDIPIDERKHNGLTKRVSKIITYDKIGRPTTVYDRHAGEQIELIPTTEALPF